ncbi:zinc metalloprotease HtpX [Candidatus Poribacteria bacterium]|nr:zinc metalloprotease HtpX [Candidatus Poribacteria bacterium]
MNNLKTALLLVVMTMLFILVGGALGGQSGMVMAFFFACLMNLGSWWFSDKIVLYMYKAQALEEKNDPALFALVREVADSANLPMPKICIMNNPSPNAFATGRNPKNAAIVFSTGIMNLLSRDELKGVIGHELAHIKNRDILISSIVAILAGAITMLASIARWGMIFGGMGGRRDDDRDSNPIVAIIVMILAPIAAMLVQFAISRSREYEADKDGARFAGNPLNLASALKRLEAGVAYRPMLEATNATAHLFIVNPLSSGGIAKLFSTHPPMTERIARLEKMAVTSKEKNE